MYPEQPQPPVQQTPPQDYLNQISSHQVQKPRFSLTPKLILLVGGILAVIIVGLAIVLNIVVVGGRQPLQQLSARLNSTASVVNDAQAKLKSSQLRSLNSSLNLYLTDINSDFIEPLKSANIDSKKIDDAIVKAESTSELSQRLEDARLNAVYDRTYAREMAYRLETIITLMQEIRSSTSNAQIKTFLDSAYPTLEPTQKAFADFNAANS